MLGKKDYQEKLYTNFQLSQRIPKDNFYRRLKGILDLHFLYKMVVSYYGKEGQKSIDPDSRIAVKPGKPRQLCYQGNISVDTASHVITNIQANKIMLMAGTAYNIQKLMRYVQKTRKTAALSMRIMAEHIYLELNNAIFQFLELFVKDKKHLGYVITCYYKNEEDAVKLYKNNL
jgi:hypothetical protein